MKITPNIAQSIVNRTMQLIKYNINIMDEKGVIIGSGDISRLNTYHQGAEKVLKENRSIEINRDNPNYLVGAREGMNLPIRFNNRAVGVVGITGDPNEVRTYGGMLQVMAELMLEEAFYWKQANLEQQSRFTLINDLIRRDPGSDIKLLQIRANLLGYNLDLPRVAVVVELAQENDYQDIMSTNCDFAKENILSPGYNKQIKEIMGNFDLRSQDLFISGIGNRIVLLKQVTPDKNKSVKDQFGQIFKKDNNSHKEITVGVGQRCDSFHKIPDSFDQALQALEVGRRLFGKGQIYFTEELGLEKFVDLAEEKYRQNFAHEILGELIKENEDGVNKQFLKTAEVYLKNNLKSGETARELFIHRNTLTYRVQRIKEKINLDLTSVEDALKFKLALLCWRFDN